VGNSNGVELRGLEGGNLLGFLAALGVLRKLAEQTSAPEVQLSWVWSGRWTPVVTNPQIKSGDELVACLTPLVCGDATINPVWTIGDNLTLSLEQFRDHLMIHAVAAGPAARSPADFLAGFGSDAYGSGPKKEQMTDTEFRTMSGAGHQNFLGFMRELATVTSVDQLRRALLKPWDYADDRPSLRWDPADYRPHALRADDPSTDPIKTMRGANRLAIEAIPFFPTMPEGRRRIATAGFDDRAGVSEITWPVWSDPLGCDSVRSLLCSAELQEADRWVMNRRGVLQVFRARRFTEGKYRNFTPARALL
jgi:hypothetical protein